MKSWNAIVYPLMLTAGCSQGIDTGKEAEVGSANEAITAGVVSGTPEADCILDVVNSFSSLALQTAVGLSSKAADNIEAYRLGDDYTPGSSDDEAFDTIAELDAIPFVDAEAFETLLEHVTLNGCSLGAGGSGGVDSGAGGAPSPGTGTGGAACAPIVCGTGCVTVQDTQGCDICECMDASCDSALALDAVDPFHAAAAIELCHQAQGTGADNWGVVDAKFVRADGSPAPDSAQWGLMESFGTNGNPLAGQRMLALSSGRARAVGQANACDSNSCDGYGVGVAPPGFPQDSPGCGGATDINDDVGLEVHLRAPLLATGYAFSFRFFSHEYPEYVCTFFNDQFIALATPPPAGAINGNISFDSFSNPVSVNVAFFDVCDGCSKGTDDLVGTGFDMNGLFDAGATSWLNSHAPVVGGEDVVLRFAIWDTGDTALDSTVIMDGFKWIVSGGELTLLTAPIEP